MAAAKNKKNDDERDHDILKPSQQEESTIRLQSDPHGRINRTMEKDETSLLKRLPVASREYEQDDSDGSHDAKRTGFNIGSSDP